VDALTLQTSKRDILGKKARFLRYQGITPTHLFGHDLTSLALQCSTTELKRIITQAGMTRLISLKVDSDKEPRRVFIREIQKDPLSGKLLHVDFYQVKRSEKIKMDVPIVLVGEAPAMKAKRRVLTYTTTSLSIECLPDKIPPVIEVDLSPLVDLEKAIYVKDIVLDPDIAVLTDPEQMIVKVSEMAAEVEEAAVKVEEVAVEEAAAEAAPTEEKEEE